jgi:2,3-bisphosphoglycerate-dependent phosphoglycerate mutase
VVPRAECLKDTLERTLPYWEDAIVPDLRAGRVVLVTAHGNSIRALIKHLDHIGDDEISELNIPYCNPLVYELDESLTPVSSGYLDPAAAAAGAAEVAAQAG